MPEKIKILIVEDHKLITQAWKIILEQEGDFSVIGDANNAEDAYQICKTKHPDIVLMDINLNESNGIEATSTISKSFSHIKVIGLSVHTDISVVKQMFTAGARGYFSKNVAIKELIEGIHKVFKGEIFIDSEIRDRYFNAQFNFHNGDPTKKELTTKEIDIIKMISKGFSSKLIAAQLSISSRTVDTHRHNIFKKLEISNAAQLSRWAIQKGYV